MIAAGRILILAPHPDDEIVACGAAAARARAGGARLFVLYLTTGVPPAEALWPWRRAGYSRRVERRRAEARRAAVMIGLEPVGFLPTPSRRLRHHLGDAAAAIADAARDSAVDALWVTAFEGGHQDHDAANALAAFFADRLPVSEFAVYNFAGGNFNGNRFPSVNGSEHTIAPTRKEAALKSRALACYASERANLSHIGRGAARETWRPLPAYDYGRPPHAGPLFRERFHWVPFRHPRIDFDRSSAVYENVGRWSLVPADRPALDDRPCSQAGQPDREFTSALDEAQR